METTTEKTKKGGKMSRMSSMAETFLEECGYDLGYSIHTLPKLKDMQMVAKTNMPVWAYLGLTEKEYYGGR